MSGIPDIEIIWLSCSDSWPVSGESDDALEIPYAWALTDAENGAQRRAANEFFR